jgi:death-on-curing protein
LSRSPNLAVYGEPDFAEFATAYGFVLAKNHPFLDENKRTAFVDVELFLRLNGYVSNADEASCVLTILALATMLYLSLLECVFVSS